LKLGSTSIEEDYEELISEAGLRHEDRQREIEHKTKLDKAQSKKDQGNGKDSSNHESSNYRGDRKKPYDNGQKKTRFSNTSKSKDKEEPKRTHHNKGAGLKSRLASFQAKYSEKKLCVRGRQSNYWWGICNSKIMAMSGRKAPALRQKNREADSPDDVGTMERSSSKKVQVRAVARISQD
jgi:hypothetical protein